MDDYKAYILSIVVAAVISSVCINLTQKMGTIGKLIKMLCGILIMITLLYPILDFSIDDISNYFSDVEYDADGIIRQSQKIAAGETARIIKTQSEAYILDRATLMGIQIDVDIILSESQPCIPVSVTICGEVSPYARYQLQQDIFKNLGIREDDQIWQ